jgi:hypothetical protein
MSIHHEAHTDFPFHHTIVIPPRWGQYFENIRSPEKSIEKFKIENQFEFSSVQQLKTGTPNLNKCIKHLLIKSLDGIDS